MLSIKKSRELLGNAAKNMSDEEVEKIRDELYVLGNIIFDSWLAEKQLKKRKYDFKRGNRRI